jgi:hypothetical protein
MWVRRYAEDTEDWGNTVDYKGSDISFTFSEIKHASHASGDFAQLWTISVHKQQDDGEYRYNGIQISVTDWFKLVNREIASARNGEPEQVYVALKKSKHFWVVREECIPPLPNPNLDHTEGRYNHYSKQAQKTAII